tara:strand:+ start:456 stop:1010 length:555 start_codon:yes stop_codon:yes gene_type:complete
MIVNTIDGSSAGGANQMLELLATVSSPDYKAKLQALQTAIQKNQTLINLIAPATEIMVIREQMTADKKASDDAVRQAGEKARASIADAKVTASQITQDAQAKADALLAEATELNAQAKADTAALAKANTEAKTAKNKADLATTGAKAKATQLDAAIKAVSDERAGVIALKAEIRAKHQAFVESL